MAGQDLDYRRFFDITTLIALRSENLFVFADTHEKIIELIRAGKVSGLRIDHVDGLRDPAAYLSLLDQAAGDTYIVVEKILESDERLPADWAVEGTTGYDFAARVNALFVDPAGEPACTDIYAGFVGGPVDYETAVYENKHLVMREVLAADVRRLVNDLVWVCERHRQHRDHTRLDLSRAMREVLADLDVYRTYVRAGTVRTVGRRRGPGRGRRRPGHERGDGRADVDPSLFGFLRDLLLKRISGPQENEFALRFQQLSGPVMAKGVEDTTFYRFNRLVSLNEVGGNPGRFGTSVEEFHEVNARMAQDWPGTLLASSTHDTKRSEDVRARISLLSEIPDEWGAAVTRWAAMNAGHKRDGMPDANAEYLLYQVLVGAHPLDVERAVAFMEKASREAKEHTSWIDPQPAYDEALAAFVRAVLADDAFTADVAAFTAPLIALRPADVAGPDAAEADVARRARHLPGHRAVGPEPGRPRQPPAGRLRGAPGRCWPRCRGRRPPRSSPRRTTGRRSCG